MTRFTTLIRRAFFLEQWKIGWSRQSIGEFLAAPSKTRFQWIEGASTGVLLADPFGVEDGEGLFILAERQVHGERRGQIVRFDAHAPARAHTLLDKGWHLSYPFVVTEEGRRYVVPEQGEAGHLAFYTLDENLQVQEDPVAVIEDMAVLDATFLHHDGYWWLFSSRVDDVRPDENLYLHYSQHLTGPYTPHPANPVVSDISRARPAGRVIASEGRLFRPGQDCTLGYGTAVNVSEIIEISPTAYVERPFRRIEPADLDGAFSDGNHQIDHTANYVLVDSKRFVFCWHAWWLKLRVIVARRRDRRAN